ncbi:hypothetical protein DMB91_03430 [Campylobacter sp. MIT 97-5078]|nr:hypothetical protein LR59_12175 [Campylobacter sp. MIT 97-5078]TQR27655.1 hypothetical protein DMB91_03430 [Campylobacter sp. MIT 97-5078]
MSEKNVMHTKSKLQRIETKILPKFQWIAWTLPLFVPKLTKTNDYHAIFTSNPFCKIYKSYFLELHSHYKVQKGKSCLMFY